MAKRKIENPNKGRNWTRRTLHVLPLLLVALSALAVDCTCPTCEDLRKECIARAEAAGLGYRFTCTEANGCAKEWICINEIQPKETDDPSSDYSYH
ncbi:hypothetical protein KJ673_01210 [Patescibacteria group bacterium]|nr:hypothetical protein [Patescibacteria group bacterium]MBU4452951.1 hypothetical protein [Patescibacteria group bacterium]